MKHHAGFMMAAMLLLTPGVGAQSAEEQVERAVRAAYQALNDSDAEGWTRHLAPGDANAGNFPRTGLVLGATAIPTETIQENFDSGRSAYDLTIHHLAVRAFGDAAVATFYTTGPSTFPSGVTYDGTYRVSQVWARESGQWKVVHFHISPLAVGDD